MRWINLLLLCFISLSLPNFFVRDFKLPPIHTDIATNPKWEVPPPSEEILKLLEQPFFYLARGNQTTAFESQDGKYVLKLFRYRPTLFPLIHQFKNYLKKRPRQNFQAKMDKTFTAAHIAFTDASQFTQVIYCHLNLTEKRFPNLELKADKTYRLPLDRYRFVIQKKVKPFKETLLQAKSCPEEMRRLIDSYLSLLVRRSALNIRNSDPNLGPNFGFLDGKAVELDFGNYHKVPLNLARQKADIENYLVRLRHWLKKHAPEYIDYLNELHRKTLISYDQAE